MFAFIQLDVKNVTVIIGTMIDTICSHQAPKEDDVLTKFSVKTAQRLPEDTFDIELLSSEENMSFLSY